MPAPPPTYEKDSTEVLDYTFDWRPYLGEADTISVVTWTVPAGLILNSSSVANGMATVWLAAGTAGKTYTIECRIATTQGRTAERAMVIRVVDRR